MLDKVLIHIGYHKTATTWLQEEIFVSSSNVFEPLSIRPAERCRELGRRFYATADNYPLSPFNLNEKEIADYLNHLLEIKPELLTKCPVFSDERLCGQYASAGCDSQAIANRLKNTFPNGKVLIVIRRQPELLLSSYFQFLYIGGTLSFQKFTQCNYDDKRPFFSPYHFDFLPLVKYYFQLFGKENVLVLPQEYLNENGPGFISRIGQFVKEDIMPDSRAFTRRHNVKESEYSLVKLRNLSYLTYTKSYTNYIEANNAITKYLSKKIRNISIKVIPDSWNRRTKEKLKAESIAFIGNRFLESNRELASIIDLDLSKYKYF